MLIFLYYYYWERPTPKRPTAQQTREKETQGPEGTDKIPKDTTPEGSKKS